MAPWPRTLVIPQLVDRKTFRDNRWITYDPLWKIPCHSLCICAVNSPVSRGRLQLPSQRVQTCSIGENLVTWQAMVGRHILEDIVGRVAQYVDEHYPVDKWHLGDLIAWVAQSALKYRPRICKLSKCLERPLKMIVCPKKLLPTPVTPCEIAVCRSTINAGSDRWPVRLQTRVGGHQH
ncbi:hypothetical protein TNCV_1140731 [Trichonephila clavipes]|nr:hypothetical protein TNCV_1140731 [Trichonephila clavipes]